MPLLNSYLAFVYCASMQNSADRVVLHSDDPTIAADPTLNLVTAMVLALDDLPIVERLKFVKNYIHGNGGDRWVRPSDPGLVMVNDVIDEVIEVLKRNPVAANLRTIDCEPGS
jgi:hypothetical protein